MAKQAKKNPPGVGRTKVVIRSDKLENSSIISRVNVQSDKLVARSDKLFMVASINFETSNGLAICQLDKDFYLNQQIPPTGDIARVVLLPLPRGSRIPTAM